MDNYFSVLNAFVDRKDSYYSIHQIGKSLGAEDTLSGFPMRVEHHSVLISLT